MIWSTLIAAKASWARSRASGTNTTYVTYVVLVPLARLLAHDAFAAIKVLQIIELAIAFGAMSWLYTVYARQRSMWAYVAGTIYALLPSVAPDVRGNVEFGLVSA